MASMEYIQRLVDQFQQKILASKNASIQAGWQHYWGIIKDKIGEYTDLENSEDRNRLTNRMYERLDGLGLEASEPSTIIVEEEEKKILANPGAWKTPKTTYFRFPY